MPLAAGLVAVLLAAAPGGSGLAPERIRERAGEILGGGDYQRELPKPIAPFPFSLPDLGLLGKLLAALGAAALLVLAILGLTWLARRLRGLDRDLPLDDGAARPCAVAEIRIASAEALAAERRYGEAIHALLLETLQALSRAARLPPSFTSREIVARVPLGPDARDALAGLVAAVEISWFGGAVPGEPEYRGCLDRFHAFLHSYRGAA
jgi:hypothetical protein